MMPASVNARLTRATCSTVTPFFISVSSRSEATSRPPLTATQPDRASSSASSGVKVFSKRMLPHQVMVTPRAIRRSARARSAGGRRGLVDEVKAGLAGLGDQRLDAIDQQVGGRGVVAADVVQGDVAEACTSSSSSRGPRSACSSGRRTTAGASGSASRTARRSDPAAGRRRSGVPASRRGMSWWRGSERISMRACALAGAHERAQQRAFRVAGRLQVLDQRQQRALAVVQGDVVDVVEHARVGEVAQLGVHVAAAQHDAGRGRQLPARGRAMRKAP